MSSEEKMIPYSMLFSSLKYSFDFQDSHLSFEYSEDQQKTEPQYDSLRFPSKDRLFFETQKQFEESSQSTELSNKQELELVNLAMRNQEKFSNTEPSSSKIQTDPERPTQFSNNPRKVQKKRTLRSNTIVERKKNQCQIVDYTYQTPSLQKISKSKPKDYTYQRASVRDQILPLRDQIIQKEKNLRDIKDRKEKTFIEIHQ